MVERDPTAAAGNPRPPVGPRRDGVGDAGPPGSGGDADTPQGEDAASSNGPDDAAPQGAPGADAESAPAADPEGAPGVDPGRGPEGAPDAESPPSAQVPALGDLSHPDLPPGFPTEESLARQGAETDDLRQDIADLRRILDVDVPPGPPPARRRPRRRRAALLIVALVIAVATLAAIAGFVVADRGGPGSDERRAERASGERGSRTGATGSPASPTATTPTTTTPTTTSTAITPTAAGTAPPPAPASAPPGSLPSRGPGVDQPGTVLVVRLAGRQSLDVVEQALLPEPATGGVGLQLGDVGRLGGEIGAMRPRVRDLRASLDGRPVDVRAAGPGRWFLPAEGRPRRVVMSYRVNGTVLASRPSESGRALGLVSPLLGGRLRAEGLPLVVRGVGRSVRGMSCPDAPATQVLCGTPRGATWTATVPASPNPVVVLQLDRGAR